MKTNYSLSILLSVMAMVPAAVAVTYTVGDANQWASGVDYTVWVTGKTFRVGDILEFKYGPTHSVSVVDKAGYDGCSATDVHSDGDTEIELKTVGTKYFICTTPGHCANGMKLAVTVVATPSPPSPSLVSPPPSPLPISPPPSPFPISPPPPTPYLPRSDGTHEASGSTKPPPPPPPSSDASSGLMSYVMVGISLVLTLQCVVSH